MLKRTALFFAIVVVGALLAAAMANSATRAVIGAAVSAAQ